jgi:RNA ligase (TIGR02306 family)
MSTLIVSLSRVEELIPIPGKDRIEVAKIKGWNCIIEKGHRVGELAIFIPPESIVPENVVDALNLGYLKKNGRVGTIKLSGVVSQGLVLWPSKLLHPEIFSNIEEAVNYVVIGKQRFNEGDNMAEVLGVKKYEPPEPTFSIGPKKESIKEQWQKLLAKEITLRRFVTKSVGIIKDQYFTPKKKLNPLFDKYTDIENVKHYNTVFKPGELVVMTEKIHGTNFRAGCLPRYVTGTLLRRLYQYVMSSMGKKYEFVYGSHTVQKTMMNSKTGFYAGDVYGMISDRYKLKEIIPQDYIVYGEIYGTNPENKSPIQKHYQYGLTEDIDVMFFDVKYKGRYLDFKEAWAFFQKLNLPTVPVLYYGPYSETEMKKATEGPSTVDVNIVREGSVIKPEKESTDMCGRKILKSINPDYLLIKDNTQWH